MLTDAFPSFLIGLREGLEAGLVVSILLAALAKAGRRDRAGSVWLGVAAAAALSLSFAAVLTFTSAHLPAKAQDVFGGVLSILAVGFVTTMVFWMRRAGASMSGDLKAKLAAALGASAGMLVFTAFAAVAREGLETALFLWTTAQTAHEKSGPAVGAVVGIAVAALLCWGLYHRALKLNLTKFFKVTGLVLVVIAAGVFAYGLTDLQESGVVGGFDAHAFDLTAHLDPNAWYSTLVAGTLNLTPKMTWLAVVGYVAYLVPVLVAYLRPATAAARPRPVAKAPVPAPAAVAEAETEAAPAAGSESPALAQRPEPGKPTPRWVLGTAVVAVPAVAAAGVIIAVGPSSSAGSGQVIEVSAAACGKGFENTGTGTGDHVFSMKNTGDVPAEVYLLDPSTSAVYGEIEGLAPGTTRPLRATLGAGAYAWRCVPNGKGAVTSAVKTVSGDGTSGIAVVPISAADLDAPLQQYRDYVTAHLADLGGMTAKLKQDVDAGSLDAAKKDWLPAHLAYNSLGAAYGTFGDWDKKINGRADGLPDKEKDQGFTGFFRLEYGLWHGEPVSALAPVADQLDADVHGLIGDWPKQDFDPADLPLRAHEILENTLQFQLTGDVDYGSGSTLATADANLAGTRVVLGTIRPLIARRDPAGLAAIDAWLDRFGAVVDAAKQPDGSWTPVDKLAPGDRQKLNGTLGELLEKLSVVPDLLEIRKAT